MNLERIILIFFQRPTNRLRDFAVGYLPFSSGKKVTWKDIKFFEDGMFFRSKTYPTQLRKLLFGRIEESLFTEGCLSVTDDISYYDRGNFNWACRPILDVRLILGDLNDLNYNLLEQITRWLLSNHNGNGIQYSKFSDFQRAEKAGRVK